MKFLYDKRRAGVLALLTVTLGLFGAGAAFAGGDAEPNAVCRNGTPNETTVPGTSFGFESGTSPSGETGVTVCYSDSLNGTPSQVAGGFVHVRQDQDGDTYLWCAGDPSGDVTANCFSDGYVRTTDPNTGAPGATASAKVILTTTAVGQTGAEVDPAVAANEPYDATTGTGGSAGAGPSTCVYVNGAAPTCPGGFTIAGLTVNEGDAAATFVYNPNGPWVTAGGPGGVGVQLPYGFGVMVGRGTNSSADTVDVSVADQHITEDVGGCYVSYNTNPDTCS